MVTAENIVCNSVKISLMRVSSGKVRNISGVNQGFFLKKDLIEKYYLFKCQGSLSFLLKPIIPIVELL